MTTYTRVSADEAMNARKDATNDAGILFKAPGASPEITKASSWNKVYIANYIVFIGNNNCTT